MKRLVSVGKYLLKALSDDYFMCHECLKMVHVRGKSTWSNETGKIHLCISCTGEDWDELNH